MNNLLWGYNNMIKLFDVHSLDTLLEKPAQMQQHNASNHADADQEL